MRKTITIMVFLFSVIGQLCAEGSTYLNFTAVNGPATISLDSVGKPYTISLQYSINDSTSWTNYQIGQILQLSNGSKVYFKATNTNTGFSKYSNGRNGWEYHYYQFKMQGVISADGNIMSLLDASMQQDSLPDAAFCFLFENCNSLNSVPSLPAIHISPNCYVYMFDNCKSIKSAPQLPATSLANECYYGMFSGCSNLVNAPALPANDLADFCYYGMFSNCTSLVSTPTLPATNLAYACYQGMFSGCSSLNSISILPATDMVGMCYSNMFGGCSSLITAPLLPAMNLAVYCYEGMFSNCTSLTTPPSLPALTLSSACYSRMFEGCTSLVTAPELPANIMDTACYEFMFSKCSSLLKVPDLPATILAMWCYFYMFDNCTSIKSLPVLSAINLPEYCYMGMFNGCSSLEINAEAPGTSWSIPSNAIGEQCWNSDMFAGTSGNINNKPEIGVTYYVASDTKTNVEVSHSDVDVSLYPNPVHIGETAFVRTSEEALTVELYDVEGKFVRKINPESTMVTIEGLNKDGVYFVRLTYNDGKENTMKLIVE